MKLLYGLANPSLDEDIEIAIREENPKLSAKQVAKEMKVRKKKLSLFGKHNTKAKSIKKPNKTEKLKKLKEVKPKKEIDNVKSI